jgi:aryl-alcohol dehydrogenase-like predicted oxidoreductase
VNRTAISGHAETTNPEPMTHTHRIEGTSLDVFPLCLGGNVFGWTANEVESHLVLDAYVAAGGNFIDTADQYVDWMDGNVGGESEAIIGSWLSSRRDRDQLVIATKVGQRAEHTGLSRRNIRASLEGSLRRLGTDYVDLYFAHRPDPSVPIEESLGTLDELVREGKARYLGISNIDAGRLSIELAYSHEFGLSKYVALQAHYNLVERSEFEGSLRAVCESAGLSCLPYFSLANGFLTGKYRPGAGDVDSPRAGDAAKYLDERGIAVLRALDEIGATHQTSPAAVALAWLGAQPTVAAPIASARTPEQLAEILPATGIQLSHNELAALDAAGRVSVSVNG